MRRSTQISLVAGALIAGIVLGRAGIAAGLAPVLLAAAVVLMAARSRLWLLGLMLLALTFGLWRTTAWNEQRAILAGLIGQEVVFTGTIADDPATGTRGQLDFKLTNLRTGGVAVPGEVAVHTYRLQLQRGYQLEVAGRLRPGFGNSVAQLGFPATRVLARDQSPLEEFRQRFFAGIRSALPEPVASFGLGLLVGIRALIPRDMQAELTLVGLSHLVAVSGYNLTIMVQAAHRLLERWGRGIALVSSLWLIAGFLVVTGGSASIVRASAVAVLSLLAAFYGRRMQPVALILVTGAATAAFEPKYLTDLGWWLSFLAFFGILVLAPAVEARLGHPKPVLIRLFIESLAAQVLTMPLILYFFASVSVVAPLTNLVVLPLIPLAMAVSFLAGLAGMMLPAFAGWLAWPAAVVLGFITAFIHFAGSLPWAGRTEHISLGVMLAMYAAILLLTVVLARQTRSRPASEAQPSLLEPVFTK